MMDSFNWHNGDFRLYRSLVVFLVLVVLLLLCASSEVLADALYSTSHIQSLSGMVHLVISAGTIGTYTVEGTNIEGLYVYFAEVSPVLETIPASFSSLSSWRMSSLFEVTPSEALFNESFSPCAGWKNQESIFRVQPDGTLIVTHPPRQSVGRVCTSRDGITYSSTSVTYEVLNVQLKGFVDLGTSRRQGSDSLVKYVTLSEIQSNPDLLLTDIGFTVGSSGGVQLVSEAWTYAANELATGWAALARFPQISRVRFSSTADCVSSPLSLFDGDLEVQRVDGEGALLFYSLANVRVTNSSFFEELSQKNYYELMISPFTVPGTFYVCVAVNKKASDGDVMVNDRLSSSRSLNISLEEENVFTLVPGLYGYLRTPDVYPKGMWVIPHVETNMRVGLVKNPTGIDLLPDALVVYPSPPSNSNGVLKVDIKASFQSLSEIHVNEFSSPVIGLDMQKSFSSGMNIIFVRSPFECSGTNLDYTVAVSHIPIQSFSQNGLSEGISTLTFFQLNSTVTTFTHPKDANMTEMRWFVCLSTSAYVPTLHLFGWSVIVHREAFFKSDTNNDVMLSFSNNFAGPLYIPLINLTYWSSQTVSKAVFSLSDDEGCRNLLVDGMKLMQCNGCIKSPRVLVPPRAFRPLQHNKTYRLCLSVSPYPILPTVVTLYIEPPHLSALGSSNETTLEVVIPNVSPVVLPVRGSGLSPFSSILFLSEKSCDQSSAHESVLNLTIRGSSANMSKQSAPDDLFVVWPTMDNTLGKRVFSEDLGTRFVCLLDYSANNSNTNVVIGTGFVVRAKKNEGMVVHNIPEDVIRFTDIGVVDSTVDGTFVVYGSSMSLSVSGYHIQNTELMPALDCGNSSSFLWTYSVPIEPLIGEKNNSWIPCANPLSCNETWYIHLNPEQTIDVGQSMMEYNTSSAQWCYRSSFSTVDNVWNSTGMTFTIVYPGFSGFLSNWNVIDNYIRLSSTSSLHTFRLAGPQVRVLENTDTRLRLALLPASSSCETYSAGNDASIPFGFATSFGEAVIEGTLLSESTLFRICYVVESSSREEGFPSKYLGIPLDVMKVQVDHSIALLTQLNGAEMLLLPQVSQILVTVNGVGLTHHTVFRLVSQEASCLALGLSPSSRESAVVVFDRCQQYYDTPGSSCPSGVVSTAFLSSSYLQSLVVGQTYKVCFQAEVGTPWLPSPVTVRLLSGTDTNSINNNRYWTKKERSSLRITPEGGVASVNSPDSVKLFVLQGSSAAFSLWCDEKHRKGESMQWCSTGLRVAFGAMSCNGVANNEQLCTLHPNWHDNIWGPMTVVDGALVVTDTGRTTDQEFWGLLVEVSSGEWEHVTSAPVFMAPPKGSSLSFSDAPQLPSPFNTSMTMDHIILIQNTPSVFYLTGFGIHAGAKVRFGAFCDHDLTEQEMISAGVDRTNVSYLIQYRQKLSNSILYTNPIPVADANGALYIPLSYVKDLQQPTPVCVSFDGGNKYHKSALTISIEKSIPQKTLNSVIKLSELISQGIVLYEGASGLMTLESIKMSTNWRFPDGTQILLLPTCEKSEYHDASVVLTWPSTVLNFSSSITSTSGELHMCAMTAATSNTAGLMDLGVSVYVIKKDLVFSSWSDYYIVSNDGIVGGALKFKLNSRSSTEDYFCRNSISTKERLMCLMNNDHFLQHIGVLQVYFTNNTYCQYYVGSDTATDAGSSPVISPTLISDKDGNIFYIPITSSLPLAPMGGSLHGNMCISVDGGRHFIGTDMRYFTGDAAPTLLLKGLSERFTRDVVETAGSTGLSGAYLDSRCAENDGVCLKIANQLWNGFFSATGWMENGTWIMNGPYAIARNVPISFEGISGMQVNTGTTVSFEMPELNCAGAGKNSILYLQQSNSGYVALIPPECQLRLTTSNVFRLIPAKRDTPDLGNPCENTDHTYLLELSVIKPADWIDSTGDALGLLWPHRLRYVPNGLYHLCVGGVERNQFSVVAVMVNIGIDKPIRQIGPYTTGLVTVYQGSNARFLLEGQALVFRQEVLISYAPAQPTFVEMLDGTLGLWDNGCYDIPVAFNQDGSSRLSAHQPLIEDYLLTTPFTRVVDKWLEIPASSLRYANSNRSFFICYSLNGGITFEPVSSDLRLVVLPPTISSINTFNFSLPRWTSPNSLSVQRFVVDERVLLPTFFVPYGTLTPSNVRVMVHSPLYYIPNIISGFVGTGLGVDSGRDWPEDIYDTISYPTVAASVAIIPSRILGGVCNKATIPNESLLALPLFILNLNTGKLWDDTQVGLRGDTVNFMAEMNPVLSNAQWKLNTQQLIREGGVNITKIIDDAFEIEQDSFIVCLSVDGVHYYSPNFMEGDTMAATSSSPVLGPLVMIPEYTSSGSTLARDVSLLVTLINRNSNCDDPPAFSIETFQRAVGMAAEVDPSVLVIQIQRAGCAPRLSQNSSKDKLMPVFALSITVSAYGSHDDAPPAILLRIVNTLHNPLVLTNLTTSNTDAFGVVELNFYYSDGQNVRNVSVFSSAFEEQWHNTFSAIPTDGISIVEITSSAFDTGRDPLHWQVIFPVILFPILLILGTLILYNKYLSTEIPQWCCGSVSV